MVKVDDNSLDQHGLKKGRRKHQASQIGGIEEVNVQIQESAVRAVRDVPFAARTALHIELDQRRFSRGRGKSRSQSHRFSSPTTSRSNQTTLRCRLLAFFCAVPAPLYVCPTRTLHFSFQYLQIYQRVASKQEALSYPVLSFVRPRS